MFLHFKKHLDEVIFHPLRNMYINTCILNQTKVIFVFLFMLLTVGNLISKAEMHIFTFKNGFLLCAYFLSFQETVYHHLVFFLPAGAKLFSFSEPLKKSYSKRKSRAQCQSLYSIVSEHLLSL